MACIEFQFWYERLSAIVNDIYQTFNVLSCLCRLHECSDILAPMAYFETDSTDLCSMNLVTEFC